MGKVGTGNGEKGGRKTLTMVLVASVVQVCKPDGGRGCIKCHPGGGSQSPKRQNVSAGSRALWDLLGKLRILR